MKLYFAGAQNNHHYDLLKKCGVKRFLSSFHYDKKKWLFSGDDDVLLDSGGYTARIAGEEIDLEEYIRYIVKYEVSMVFNLDVMDLDQAWRNQHTLEECTNAYVLPVYHMEEFKHPETREVLDKMIRQYEFISVGGVAGVTNSFTEMCSFLDYVFSRTTDRIRVHGLGLTSERVLRRYPFYSVDSTSWLHFQKFGNSKFMKDKKRQLVMAKKIHYKKRNEFEIYKWLELEETITALWAKRGVTWQD